MVLRAGAELLALAAQAATLIYIARAVPPDVTGDLAVALALLPLVDVLTAGGLTQALSPQLAASPSANLPLRRVLRFRLVVALALFLLAQSGAGMVASSSLRHFVRVSAFGWFGVALDLDWLFVARGYIATAAASRAFTAVGRLALMVAVVRGPGSAGVLPVAWTASVFVGVAAAWALASSCGLLVRRAEASCGPAIAAPAGDSLQFLAGELSVYALTQADRFLIYILAGAEATGLYYAAQRLLQPLYSISTVVNATLYRDLAATHMEARSGGGPADSPRLRECLGRYFRWMLYLTVPVGPFVWLFSSPLIGLAYGPAYARAAPVLAVSGFVVTFGYVSGSLVLPLKAWGLPAGFTRAVTLAGLVSLGSCLVLVPFLGAAGAALAALAGMVVATLAGYAAFRKAAQWSVRSAFLRPLGAAVVASLAGMIGLFFGQVWAIALFAASYVAADQAWDRLRRVKAAVT